MPEFQNEQWEKCVNLLVRTDASTSRLMTYFEKEYRAAGALSDRHAHLRPMAGAAAAHPLATGRRRKFNRLSMRVDAGENKRFSDHIEHID